MNLKKIEREIEKILDLEGLPIGEIRQEWQKRKLLSLYSRVIREVVESVPVEEEKLVWRKDIVTETKEVLNNYVNIGINLKTKEIKRWKEKILKQLKEGK